MTAPGSDAGRHAEMAAWGEIHDTYELVDNAIAGRVTTVPMIHWGVEIRSWVAFLRGSSKPDTTLGLREYQIRRFSRDWITCNPWSLTLDDLASWLGGHDWAPETRRSYRAALRSFYNWAHITGRISQNPAAQLPAITPPLALPRPAPELVFRQSLMAADPRVRLMLELAGFAGLRRAEIACVHTDDLSEDDEGIVLLVHGKGRKERPVPIDDSDLERHLRELPPGWAFPGHAEGRYGYHLSPARVGELISEALPDHWTAHTLRHRFSKNFYAEERDIRATQEILGHASVATTQRYTPVPPGALRRSMKGTRLRPV